MKRRRARLRTVARMLENADRRQIGLEWVRPFPEIDPMTGERWAFPFSVRRITLAEAQRMFPGPSACC